MSDDDNWRVKLISGRTFEGDWVIQLVVDDVIALTVDREGARELANQLHDMADRPQRPEEVRGDA